jgi:hypothetical protein
MGRGDPEARRLSCSPHAGGGTKGGWLHLRRRRPLGLTGLPTSLPLLGPDLDRLLAGDLPAVFEQRYLARDKFTG